MYEHRIKIYKYGPTEKELFELIHYRSKHKVDHLDGNSKDVCDGIVGAVWNAIMDTSEDVELKVNEDTKLASKLCSSSDYDEDFDDLMKFTMEGY